MDRDRQLWIAIRRALMMIVAAIDKRWEIDEPTKR